MSTRKISKDEARVRWAKQSYEELRSFGQLFGDMAKSLSALQDIAERNAFLEEALEGNAKEFVRRATAFGNRIRKRKSVMRVMIQNSGVSSHP